MKYVRTKDGRIINLKTSNVIEEIAGIKYDILGFRLKTTMQYYDLKKEDIVKITDTIEELCDEFVYYNVYQERNIILSDFDEAYIHYGTINETPFYGAIWTDWGLKYVAKMNSKGEFELL